MTQQDLLDEFVSVIFLPQKGNKIGHLALRVNGQPKAPIRGTDAPLQDGKFIGTWSDRQS